MQARRLITLAPLLGALFVAEHALAVDPYAFVWANQPTTGSYVPDSRYQYNAAGFENRASRLSRGRYRIDMPLAASPYHGGNVQVTAYGGNHRCKVSSWYRVANVDIKVYVRCFDTAGGLTDGRFIVLYHNAEPYPEDVVFAWIDEAVPTTFGREPRGHYAHSLGAADPAGPPIWYQRRSQGVYLVLMAGYPDPERTFLVTAYGGEAIHCNIFMETHESGYVPDKGWIARMAAEVRCYDSAGHLADSRFTVAMAQERGFGSPHAVAAYTLVDRPTASSSSPGAETSWNSEATLRPVHSREGLGRYKLYLWSTGGTYAKSTVLVTAKSLGGSYCNVMSWKDVGSFTEISVRCYNAYGLPADSQYFATFLSGE